MHNLQTDKFTKEGLETMSETLWFRRNSEGKLNKKVFEKVTDYPVNKKLRIVKIFNKK